MRLAIPIRHFFVTAVLSSIVYANAITFTLAINKGEVNAIDLMLIEGIRIFYPRAYGIIKRNKDTLTARNGGVVDEKELQAHRAKFEEEVQKGLQSEEAKALLTLLKSLFPRFGGIILTLPPQNVSLSKPF